MRVWQVEFPVRRFRSLSGFTLQDRFLVYQHRRQAVVPQSIWHQCLEVLRDEFPAQQFNTWLRPLQPQLDEGNLVLFAPNRFVMDWVNQKYLRRIEEVIKDLEGGQAPRVNMKVGSAQRETGSQGNSRSGPAAGRQAGLVPRSVPVTEDSSGLVTEEERGVAASVPPSSSASRRSSVQVEGDIKHQS